MNNPMYLQIYHHLLTEIRQGQLKAGDRVPSEKELADTFSVSRITSKKALEMLASAKLIERERGRGSFVAQQLPDLASLDTAPPVEARQAALIGLVISDFSDAYGMEIVKALEQHCTANNCSLVIKVTLGQIAAEQQAIDQLVASGVDGIIVMPVHGEFYNAELLRLVLQDYPLVLIDRYLKGIPAYTVHTDNVAAAELLTGYLLERGHEQIAFVSPPYENTSTIEDRIQGYKNALAAQRIAFDAAICFSELTSTMPPVFAPDKTRRDVSGLKQFFTTHPQLTAVVASEYNVALLVYEALSELGRQSALEITCFDYPRHALRQPMFTHIRQDETHMAQLALDVLLKRVAKAPIAMHHVVAHDLLEA